MQLTHALFDPSTEVVAHRYVLSDDEISTIFSDDLYQRIIRSRAFQRLKNIHFLGAIDYTIDVSGPKPNKRHTRFQHSLAVAKLALEYAKHLDLDLYRERVLVTAALLHDIGHAPLSHSLESVFSTEYGINHHIVGERIIRGEISLGSSLYKALHKWDINPFDVMSIIAGVGKAPYRDVFSYAINIDTIEAIIRASTYIYPTNTFYTPSEVLKALVVRSAESTEILDKFWLLKHDVYSKIINNSWGVMADFLCQKYMRDNVHRFSESYYYGTESQLRKEHSALFRSLEALGKTDAKALFPSVDAIPCKKRIFSINSDIEIESMRDINRRYIQKKEPAIIEIKNKDVITSNERTVSRQKRLIF